MPSSCDSIASCEVLIGCALFLAPVLKFLPRSVLQGVFFYMGIASLTGGREEVKKDVVGVQHWTSCSWWPAHYRIIDNNHVYIYIYINDIINIVFFLRVFSAASIFSLFGWRKWVAFAAYWCCHMRSSNSCWPQTLPLYAGHGLCKSRKRLCRPFA